jgi:TusA-related sulfurtransferase
MFEINGFVDCVSLACPSIFLKTQQKMAEMKRGDTVEVLTESPDIDQLLIDYRVKGYKVLGTSTDELGVAHIIIEK